MRILRPKHDKQVLSCDRSVTVQVHEALVSRNSFALEMGYFASLHRLACYFGT